MELLISKRYSLNQGFQNIIFKKIFLNYSSKKNPSFHIPVKKKLDTSFIDFFIIQKTNSFFNYFFLKKVFFYNNLVFSNFFSNKVVNLVIALKITKFNFFLTTSSDSLQKWTFFSKEPKTLIRKPQSSSTQNLAKLAPIVTFSAGQLVKKRRSRLKFETINIGVEITILIISIFWSFLNKYTSKFFNFDIRVKGTIKWVRFIIRLVRKAFRKLYKEHRWYIKKNQLSAISNDFEHERYFSSVQRIKQIVDCPVFFNFLQSVKQLPHNGCRLKKIHVRRKDIKRINMKRKNR